MTQPLPAREYTCGYCGRDVASASGVFSESEPSTHFVYFCPNCGGPTFFVYSDQTPGIPYGGEVQSLPEDIAKLYNEARGCVIVDSFTAAAMTCRKVLMNVAVSKGAAEGLKFTEYVEYLANEGYIPRGGREWVDKIRKRGNEANHEIALMSRGDAEELISFVEMLLKNVFEFPARV